MEIFFQGGFFMNTSTLTQTTDNTSAAAYMEAAKSDTTEKTGTFTGKSVGNPQLSEKAAKYYEQLKKKYSNMDFILVSSDKKDEAEANAAQYANPTKTVVLIDEEKIERMAEDEEYREKYESILSSASSQLSSLQSGLGTDSSVTGYGIKVNDNGTASFFAVIDKSLAAQKERIEKKAEEKAEEKKKAAKEEREERLEKSRDEKKEIQKEKEKDKVNDDDFVTVTASSVEELLQKIQDVNYSILSDLVQTEDEKKVGQNIDYSV
jgi:hypothetical protein